MAKKRNKCDILINGRKCIWRNKKTGRCTDPFGCLPMIHTPITAVAKED